MNLSQLLTPNRIVAFGGPYIALASGFIATWLGSHLTFLHIFANHDKTANQITKAIVFLAGTGVTWALHQKWLTGWAQYEFHTGYGLQAGVPGGSVGPAPPPPPDLGQLGPPAPSAVVLPPDALVEPAAAPSGLDGEGQSGASPTPAPPSQGGPDVPPMPPAA